MEFLVWSVRAFYKLREKIGEISKVTVSEGGWGGGDLGNHIDMIIIIFLLSIPLKN